VIFKSHLDVVLGNRPSVSLLEQEGWSKAPEFSSNLNHSLILWFWVVIGWKSWYEI